MSTRIAVTGANGFVGRHVVQAAAATGLEPVGVVRSEAAARLIAERGGRPAVVPELASPGLAAAIEGAVAVVHLAQIGAERGGATYEAVNLGGTRAVVEAARRAGVPRLVFLSGLGVARYGMSARCTNPYFLSKLSAELELQRSGLQVAVFRPSYVVGAGGELIPGLVEEMERGEVELVGDGAYRLQPIDARDAAAAILAAATGARLPAVYDLVGPEPMSYRGFVGRVAAVARALGRGGPHRLREIEIGDAERQARAGGYRGLLPDELDCLLCDEVADARPLRALLGRSLMPVDAAIGAALGRGR